MVSSFYVEYSVLWFLDVLCLIPKFLFPSKKKTQVYRCHWKSCWWPNRKLWVTPSSLVTKYQISHIWLNVRTQRCMSLNTKVLKILIHDVVLASHKQEKYTYSNVTPLEELSIALLLGFTSKVQSPSSPPLQTPRKEPGSCWPPEVKQLKRDTLAAAEQPLWYLPAMNPTGWMSALQDFTWERRLSCSVYVLEIQHSRRCLCFF